MFRGGRLIAVVPARGGSKRFPRKNLAIFLGESLTERALKHAFGVPEIDLIVLASDSEEILNIAKPPAIKLRLPDHLASDQAGATAAALHALLHHPADWLLLLQPTSPLRQVSDIAACLKFASQYGARTVTPSGTPSGHVYLASAPMLQSGMSLNDSCLERIRIAQERCVDVDYPSDLQDARNALRRF